MSRAQKSPRLGNIPAAHSASSAFASAAASSRPVAAALSDSDAELAPSDDDATMSEDEFALPEGGADDDDAIEKEVHVEEEKEDGSNPFPPSTAQTDRTNASSRLSGFVRMPSTRRSTGKVMMVAPRAVPLHAHVPLKRGLGDLRADSLYYSTAEIGAGVLMTSGPALRSSGPQAVVLCERSRDRKGHERARQAAKLAELKKEDAARVARAADEALRSKTRQEGLELAAKRRQAQREADARTATEVRQAARMFDLKLHQHRSAELARAIEDSKKRVAIAQANKAQALKDAEAMAQAAAKIREANRRTLAARRALAEAREEPFKQATREEKAVRDPTPEGDKKKEGEDSDEEEEEETVAEVLVAPQKAANSNNPPSPHRRPSLLHISRAVPLDSFRGRRPTAFASTTGPTGSQSARTASSSSSSSSLAAVIRAATASPPVAGRVEHDQQSHERPLVEWSGATQDSAAFLIPKRDMKAAQARAKDLAAQTAALEKRAEKMRKKAQENMKTWKKLEILPVPGEKQRAAAYGFSKTANSSSSNSSSTGEKTKANGSRQPAGGTATRDIVPVDSGTMD